MDFFKYNAIDLEGSAFRLIRLFKGEDDTIQCELFQAYLPQQEDGIEYEALSYTWGDIERPYEIIVNGSRMAVTENLHLALRYLRSQTNDRILWIDAICINQDNRKERGHQVQQMSSIYNKAQRVVIWLGRATPDTDFIMYSLKQLEKESIKYACSNWKTTDERWAEIWSSLLTDLSNEAISRQHKGIQSLLDHSWFKRVWILQEVANARAATIVCGRESVSARIFALAPSLIGITPDPHCQAVLDIMPGPPRKSSWWTKKRDLQTLLVKFGKSEASDPLDNIYALLGISSDAFDSEVLKANYEKSIQEAIQDTTLFLLHLYEFGEPIPCLPSWTLQEFIENLDYLSNAVFKWAVEIENKAVMRVLLERNKVDKNSKDNSGQTLISWVSERGNYEAVKLLVEGGDIDLNTEERPSWTPLSGAAERGYGAVMRLLVEGVVNVNMGSKNTETTLYHAALRGNMAVVQAVVASSVGIDIKDNNGEVVLYWAVLKGHEAIAQVLVDSGVDVNMKDSNGETMLYRAVMRKDRAVVRLLLKVGADASIEDNNGKTVLDQAISGGRAVLVQVLIDGGVDVNMKNNNGETTLFRAVMRKDEVVIRGLLNRGADVNVKDNNGETALYRAVVKEDEEIVQLLLRFGADVNVKDNNGETALYRAVERREKEVVRLLVERGAEVNTKSYREQIIVHWAALIGHETVVQLLVNGVVELLY